jgi:hypothetical protein
MKRLRESKEELGVRAGMGVLIIIALTTLPSLCHIRILRLVWETQSLCVRVLNFGIL